LTERAVVSWMLALACAVSCAPPALAALGEQAGTPSAAAAAAIVRALNSGAMSSTLSRDPSTQRIQELVTFTPQRSNVAVDRFVSRSHESYSGPVAGRRRFFADRLHDFRTLVSQYGMRPNDLATARAFAIVVGYRAYNGEHLRDALSGRIMIGLLALDLARTELANPWNDARKQDLYETLGIEASTLNWSLERALQRSDASSLRSLRTRARTMLREQLGRNPDTVTPDTYPCVLYRSAPCTTLVRQLRENLQADSVTP
jgi:uncharacterized protein DUF6683